MEHTSSNAKDPHPAIEIIAQRMLLEQPGPGSLECSPSQGATRGRRWNVLRKTQKSSDWPTLNCIVAAWRLGLIRSSLVWYSLYLTDLGSAWLRRYWTKAQMIELSYGCMALKATKERPPGPRRRSKKAGSTPAEEKEKTSTYQYAEHLGQCVIGHTQTSGRQPAIHCLGGNQRPG
ncbi:alpha V2 [Tomato leaf curl Virudhunagar alphasatellite]|uniref:Alpha V2 n=1 Tax=Tomato leaf curl Virudhunagar alphasatellite TaxID=2048879 RepID=A0A2D1P844_9VIRU|nr:alpha V2 [Tomato leaf curl Virudhunagar alphasatellite]ATO87998.1 alpha V2 [Tomato leaf curl Virudhunagar alphasatellite]